MVREKQVVAQTTAPSTALQVHFGQSEIDLIQQTKAAGASEAEFNLFVYDCQARGLNPLKNEIHFVKRGSGDYAKATHQVGIDGFRIIAQRTGEYEGQTRTIWSDKVATVGGVECPEWCEVGVYRKGFKEALYARAYFVEYCQVFNGKVGNVWAKLPRTMLEKVAESKALRKSFPDTLAGLYTDEEMSQATSPKHVEVAHQETGEIIEKVESPNPLPLQEENRLQPENTEKLEKLLITYQLVSGKTDEEIAVFREKARNSKQPMSVKLDRLNKAIEAENNKNIINS